MLFNRLCNAPNTNAPNPDFWRDLEAQHDHLRAARNTECPDLHHLAQALGIKVSGAWLREDLSGMIISLGDEWEILYNAEHSISRQRFSIAHMIGHHFLHRDLLSAGGRLGANDDLQYRQVRGALCYNPAILPKHEMQANRFAIHLLMPAPIVRRLVSQSLSTAEIADRLATSIGSITIRLETLGLKTENKENRLADREAGSPEQTR